MEEQQQEQQQGAVRANDEAAPLEVVRDAAGPEGELVAEEEQQEQQRQEEGAAATAPADDAAPPPPPSAPAPEASPKTARKAPASPSPAFQRLTDSTRRLRELDAKLGARCDLGGTAGRGDSSSSVSGGSAGGAAAARQKLSTSGGGSRGPSALSSSGGGGKGQAPIAPAAPAPRARQLSRAEVEAMGARLSTPRVAGASAAAAPRPPSVRLVFSKGAETWLPVKQLSRAAQEESMSALYQRCRETRAATDKSLADKYLVRRGPAPAAAAAAAPVGPRRAAAAAAAPKKEAGGEAPVEAPSAAAAAAQ